LISQAHHLSESADELEESVEAHLLAGQLATLLAARYAALLNSWDGEVEAQFVEKVRLLRALNQDIALLQRTMRQAGQHKREHEQAEEDKEKRIIEEVKKETLAPIWAKLDRDQYEVILGGGERGRKLAEVITAVKYDLPKPEGWDEWKRKKDAELAKKTGSKSKSQASSPTQSKPVKPDTASSKTTDTAEKEAEQS
jgi:type II secretory pathway component PulJ